MPVSYSLAIASLQRRLHGHGLKPTQLVQDVLAAAPHGDHHHAWIYRLPDEAVLAQAQRLETDKRAKSLPLYGVPFAIKDNIDAAGCPTTAGCPAFGYTAERTAPAVQRLIDAGAILIGKTNMDQFACGLVGTRSPYGACTNAFRPAYIAGGSSSGSALAVSLNLVSFALGTDTAGSGRVPAAMNNIVGLKPTRGMISTTGVVPACRSLDCVSIFALTADDAWRVYQVARAYDATDPYSRHCAPAFHARSEAFRCGIPAPQQLDFCGDAEAQRMFMHGVELIQRAGGDVVEIDFEPFREAASLLYQGPWLAERAASLMTFFDAHQDDMHPTTRAIIAEGARYSAADAFAASHRLQALNRLATAEMEKIDVMAVPTVPTVYTVADVAEQPQSLNATLGLYTNFVNLLDLSALAVPSGMRADGLPSGITLVAPAFSEPMLCELGARIHRLARVKLGATDLAVTVSHARFIDSAGDAHITIAVAGAHLSGMPLNHELTTRGARLLRRTRTAPHYRLYVLPGFEPQRPGLVRTEGKGHAIEVELWRMPVENFGPFVARIPEPLAMGTVVVEGGVHVTGFLCEAHAVSRARDISAWGAWDNFVANAQRHS